MTDELDKKAMKQLRKALRGWLNDLAPGAFLRGKTASSLKLANGYRLYVRVQEPQTKGRKNG